MEDASIGTFSPTFASKGTILLDGVGGGAQDIIAGRRPLTDLDGLVQEWRKRRRHPNQRRARAVLCPAHERLSLKSSALGVFVFVKNSVEESRAGLGQAPARVACGLHQGSALDPAASRGYPAKTLP